MSVHKAITKHVEDQNRRITLFHQLEEQREQLIDEAVKKCDQNDTFSVEEINAVTTKINQLAQQGAVPSRKLVTIEMVKDYVQRKKDQ